MIETKTEICVLSLDKLDGACQEQLRIIHREWPEGIPLTAASAARAVELGLDIDWAAKKLLRAPAWAEYERVRAAAWAEYERVQAAAWAEYDSVKAAEMLRLFLTQ